MKKKNVLIICKESYTMPMHFLGKLLRKDDVNLAAFFIMPHESLFNNSHYKFFKEANADIPIYDVKEVSKKFIDDVDQGNIQLDKAYLNKIEREYSNYKNINLQFVSSQFHAYYYHDLDIFHHVSYDVQLYWLQLYYQRIEEIMEEFKPDVIYDTDIAELGRVLLLEICRVKNIPYVSLDYGRIENYVIPTYCLGLNPFPPFRDDFEIIKQQLKKSGLDVSQGSQYLSDVRKKRELLAEDYKMVNPLLKKWNFFLELINTIGLSLESFYWWMKTLRIRKGPLPIYGRYFSRIVNHWFLFFRNISVRLFERRYFQRVDTKKTKYILFPLHLIPESSTFSLAPYFCTETFLIESLSKSVPWDVKIVVKEHWCMLSQRSLSFYKKIKTLPNVILVSPFQFKDPKQFIEDSIGVITITGTSALEAALLGKPSIIFGPTSFEMLSCVSRITDVTKMRDIILEWLKGNVQVYDYELAAYIEAVFKHGENLSLKTLLLQDSGMKLTAQDEKWLIYQKKSIVKHKILRLFGLSRYCPPPLEEMESKVIIETEKLKRVLERGVTFFDTHK